MGENTALPQSATNDRVHDKMFYVHMNLFTKMIVGEPKLRIMQKHTNIAPERYTAEFLYMECLDTG